MSHSTHWDHHYHQQQQQQQTPHTWFNEKHWGTSSWVIRYTTCRLAAPWALCVCVCVSVRFCPGHRGSKYWRQIMCKHKRRHRQHTRTHSAVPWGRKFPPTLYPLSSLTPNPGLVTSWLAGALCLRRFDWLVWLSLCCKLCSSGNVKRNAEDDGDTETARERDGGVEAGDAKKKKITGRETETVKRGEGERNR